MWVVMENVYPPVPCAGETASPLSSTRGEAEGGSARLVAVLEVRAGSSASSGGTGGLVCAEG